MILENLFDRGKAKARSEALGGEQRFHDPGENLRRNAGAIVGYDDFCAASGSLGAHPDAGIGSREFGRVVTAPHHRFRGVGQKIGDHPRQPRTIDLDLLSKKRVSLIGVTFRTRDVEEFAAVVRAAWRDLGAMVASGRFAMPVERVFALDAADAAQEAMRDNRHLGKFILEA